MRNIKDKIQDKLNEDIGRVPGDDNIPVDPELEQAVDSIAEYFKTNFSTNREEEYDIKRDALNMFAALDNKFTGKYSSFSEIIFKACIEYCK